MNVSSHSLRRLRLRGITALVGAVAHSTSRCSPSPSSTSSPQAFLWQPARWHSSSNSNSGSSSTQAREDAAAVLPVLQKHFDKSSFQEIVSYVDDRFDASKQNFLTFCRSECDARDIILLLMRAYTALGRMDKVRHIFVVALRDLQAVEVSTTPSSVSGIKGRRGGSGKALAMDNAPLIPAASSSSSINGKEAIVWTRPSLLNVGLFNGYLEVLTRRKNYDAAEAMWVLAEMKEAGVEPDALTYHYLMEIQVRAGYDPKGLWDEAMGEHHLQPLPATVQMLLSRVVPSGTDAAFVVAVTREALRYGAAVMDKRMMVELIGQWLQQRAGASSASSSSSSSSNTTPVGGAVLYPPEYVMWLILELEMRCLLDKSSFAHYIQRQQLAELLLRCAKAADSVTASQLLALMDRHAMSRTADILSLVVWCWAQALELDKAFGVVEVMARKGYLELTDPFKRHHIECLRYGMDKHFLMILADAVSTPAALDKLLVHFAERRRQGLPVSVHALDVLVLAAGKMGAERRALHLVSTYESTWGVRPRTNTFNCLLVGCSAHRGGAMHDLVYEEMLKAGVAPSPQTFRVLIRQAVLNDDVDTAVKYLQEVTKRAGLRVEVEMILPILERAARAGDGDTVNRISKYALDCDIGIDGAVLQTVMKCLTDAGQSVEVLRGHQPLHEALRSRSKVGRQRARNELLL